MTAGYVRRGLSPDAGVSYFLPRHVGLARAADILLTGRDVDADGGGAHRSRHAGRRRMTAFADRVRAYAAQLAAGPPVAHALTKRLLVRSLDTPLDVRAARRAREHQAVLRDARRRRSDRSVSREAATALSWRVGELDSLHSDVPHACVVIYVTVRDFLSKISRFCDAGAWYLR